MANRSYLYSLDIFSDCPKPRAIGLSESECNIPLIYRILVSSAPQATESILFSGQGKIAITADYDGGVRKLEEFFSKLPQEYKEKADNVIKFLKDYKNRQTYIHLECAEIFEMEADEDEFEKKNAELVEEIKNIDEEIKKALKRIHYDGDTFELRELEAEYWTNTLFFTPGSGDEDENGDNASKEHLSSEYSSAPKNNDVKPTKKSSIIIWDILVPLVIAAVGIIVFVLTGSQAIVLLTAVLLFIYSKIKKNREAPSDFNGKNDDVETYTHEQAKMILQRIHDTDGADSIRIKTAVKETPLSFTESKFGGLPYWERTDEFPRDEDGKPLYLLAQINFADVPHLPDFPEKGLLQIFVKADDLWGLDFKDERQKNWRIVYHKSFSPNLAMNEAELRAMGIKTAADKKDEDEYLPFEKEYSLTFEKEISYVHPNLEDFDDKVKQIAKELGFPVFEGGSWEWFEEDDYNAFCVGEEYAHHQIGGYPNFTQSDVRREGDVLLFQMDSEHTDDGWEILWGDCGIANFFISREALKNLDFSNVLYNWDCY